VNARGRSGRAAIAPPGEIAATALFEEQTDQIDDARTCLLDIRSQVLGAEELGNLHHPLRRVVEDVGEFLLGDDSVAHAVHERSFEKRSIVK
jgi:hypothetical protein